MNSTRYAVLLLAIAITATTAAIPAVSSTNEGSDWPQFHLDSEHQGATQSSAPHDNRMTWASENIGAQEGSSVSVAGGCVYINCIDRLVCLDRMSGRTLWNASLSPTADVCNVWGFSPAYHDGMVFLTGSKVVCINATNGSEKWSYSFPTERGSVDGGPAVVDGRVIVGDWDGHNYYCLDEYTGKQIWNFTVEGNAQSTPAISNGLVVLAGWEWGVGGRIYCLDLENGTEIWNLSTSNSPCGSAALDGNRAYLTTYSFDGDGDVLAISLHNGSLLWQKSIARSDSTPALSGGRLYVCGGTDGFSDKATYCFDAENGSQIWKTEPQDEIGEWRCSPAYADGLVFVGQTQNMNYTALCALDAITGKMVWSYPAGGSAPAVANGIVYSIGGGKVYAFGDGGRSS